jgi:hypothetical protein
MIANMEQGERQFREFKSAIDRSTQAIKGRDVKAVCRDIGETLVSFANADGEAPQTYVHKDTPLPNR